MALSPRIELRQKLDTRLSPHQRQGLRLLRLSAADLDGELARLAAANPMLIHHPEPLLQRADSDVAARVVDRPPSLVVGVARQLQAMRLPKPVMQAAHTLLMDLREDGYLDMDAASPLGPAETQALEAIQACEPPGVGARTLPECLMLQLRAKGLDKDAAQATIACLPLFATQDVAALRAALSLDTAAVHQRIALLRGLRAAPHDAQADDARPAYLRPDLRLTRTATGILTVSLARETRQRLRLNDTLIRRAQAEGFGAEMIAAAQSLLAVLDNRGATLVRLGTWLLEKHGEAMASGNPGPTPATRAMAAQDLSVHPSTIGRAVADKTLDIDGRLFALSTFFSGPVSRQNPDFSGVYVQSRIASMIASEPTNAPLPDHDITMTLNAEGVDIARRTVAKYRQGLGIPIASKRRRTGR